MLRDGGRIGAGCGEGRLGRCAHDLARLVSDRVDVVAGQHPLFDERVLPEEEGIVLGLVLELVGRTVLALVVRLGV